MAATTFKKTDIGKKYWTRRIIAPSLRNIAAEAESLEETMSRKIRISNLLKTAQASHKWMRLSTLIPAVCLAFPIAALAQGGSPFDTGFTLPPGKYTLKFLARENETGKMGTYETKFNIPDLAPASGALKISSVIWSNQRQPLSGVLAFADNRKKLLESNPLVQDGQKIVPSITHVFRRDQNIYVYLEVYD